jgi:hypothetical protein
MHRRVFGQIPSSDPEFYASRSIGNFSGKFDLSASNAIAVKQLDQSAGGHPGNENIVNADVTDGTRGSQSGLLDLTRLITTSNKYPSAHGGSSDVWTGFWRSESVVREVGPLNLSIQDILLIIIKCTFPR